MANAQRRTNGEVFITPREREVAFRNWCLGQTCGKCQFWNRCGDYARFKWLELPYKRTSKKRTLADDARDYFEATKKDKHHGRMHSA